MARGSVSDTTIERPPSVSPGPSDLYLRTAELLMERGWTQGERRSLSGALCLRGAFKLAAAEYAVPHMIYWSVLQRWLMANEEAISAVAWNDDPARSAEDVVLALKRCAADQR